MTVAVIADVHGNAWALDAVLADARARGADTFLDLGDTLDGPLDPVPTADRLMALGALTVRGNHDRMMVERDPTSAHALLRPEHHEWLAGLPAVAEHEDIVLFHATPYDDLTMLLETMSRDGTQTPGPPAWALATGSPHARYALLRREERRWRVEPRVVAYPWADAVAAARAAGRDDWVAPLATGWPAG